MTTSPSTARSRCRRRRLRDRPLVLGYDGLDCAKAALQAAVEAAQAFGDGIVVAFGAGVYPIGEDSDHKRMAAGRGTDRQREALSAIRSGRA